jgi:hypothetical protein
LNKRGASTAARTEKVIRMTVHTLKIRQKFLRELIEGTKTFEIRYNDRDYKVGDILRFCGDTRQDEEYDGFSQSFDFKVTYILSLEDVPNLGTCRHKSLCLKDWVVLSVVAQDGE